MRPVRPLAIAGSTRCQGNLATRPWRRCCRWPTATRRIPCSPKRWPTPSWEWASPGTRWRPPSLWRRIAACVWSGASPASKSEIARAPARSCWPRGGQQERLHRCRHRPGPAPISRRRAEDEARTALQAIELHGARSSAGPPRPGWTKALADESEETALEGARPPPPRRSTRRARRLSDSGRQLLRPGRLTKAPASAGPGISPETASSPAAYLPLGEVTGMGNVESAHSHPSRLPQRAPRQCRHAQRPGPRRRHPRRRLAKTTRPMQRWPTPHDPTAVWTRTQVALAAGDGNKALRNLEKRAKASRSPMSGATSPMRCSSCWATPRTGRCLWQGHPVQ